MPTLVFDKDFLDDFARLEPPVRQKVRDLPGKFADAAHAGVHLERLTGSLDDRVRTIADGVAPGEYGRREAFRVHQELKVKGPVTVPQEFVFMDRAAIGLGSVFLHLRAELNFFRMIEEELGLFAEAEVARRQAEALAQVGLAPALAA